ncbi:hypothetical protein CGCSCA5_v002927 [Colletotrichum siamense]|nr:hypothetical protein CGCSCA5_v002927 [Colletotrichum siamense]
MFSPPFVCDSSVVGNCCTKRPVHTEKTLLPDRRSICDTTPSSQRPRPFSGTRSSCHSLTAHMHGGETHIHPPDISRKVRRTSVGQVAFDGRHSSTPLHFLALYPANQHSQQPVLRFLILDAMSPPCLFLFPDAVDVHPSFHTAQAPDPAKAYMLC